VASVGTLIALGSILGKLLADSGGADQIVDTILARTSEKRLPWAMALIAGLIGLPLFFEVGIVLLIPVVLLVAKRGQPLADPDRHSGAGRPVGDARPGAAAPGTAGRDRRDPRGSGHYAGARRLGGGAHPGHRGPAVRPIRGGWVDVSPPERMTPARASDDLDRRPSFAATVCTMLLPVALMLSKALADVIVTDQSSLTYRIFDVIGTPLIALLAAVCWRCSPSGGPRASPRSGSPRPWTPR